MRKRGITASALAALAAAAIGLGVVAAPAAAAPAGQSCHGGIVSAAVQSPELGPGARAAATRFLLDDYPQAVQDAQRAVRAFCASGGVLPPGETRTPFFTASTKTFWFPVSGTECYELYTFGAFNPALPDPTSTEHAPARFDYTSPQTMEGMLTVLAGVNASATPYLVDVASVVALCGTTS